MLTVWLSILAHSKFRFLGSCPLSIGWKIYHWSVWQGMWFVVALIGALFFFQIIVSLGFGFRLIILQKSTQISFKEQSATIYQVQAYGQRVEKCCLIVQKLRQIMHLFHHRPNCTLHWSDLRCMREGSARPRLRWHWRSYSCVAAWFWWQWFCKEI